MLVAAARHPDTPDHDVRRGLSSIGRRRLARNSRLARRFGSSALPEAIIKAESDHVISFTTRPYCCFNTGRTTRRGAGRCQSIGRCAEIDVKPFQSNRPIARGLHLGAKTCDPARLGRSGIHGRSHRCDGKAAAEGAILSQIRVNTAPCGTPCAVEEKISCSYAEPGARGGKPLRFAADRFEAEAVFGTSGA